MTNNDVDSTGRRRALEAAAREDGFRNAESVYRAVAALRDQLPDEARRQVVVMLEWAREGIARQNGEATAELAALHAAYTYARDVLAGTRLRDRDYDRDEQSQ